MDLAPDPIITPTTNILFDVGDFVRISLKVDPKAFARGFEKLWSDEIFTVIRVNPFAEIATYSLADLTGTPVTGRYYPIELNRITVPQN